MLGIMRASIGYAAQRDIVVSKGDLVTVTPATNLPPGSIIEFFVEKIGFTDQSIGCTRHEVHIFDGRDIF